MLKVTSEPIRLKDVLEGKFYHVPLYQREYAWEIDEVSALYHDIENSGSDEHFLGALLLGQQHGSKNNLEIIDGQQRLITLLLLLAIIRQDLISQNNRNLDKYIFDIPETIDNVKTSVLNVRFKANKRDDELLSDLIKGEKYEIDRRRKSHKYLTGAYDFLTTKIEQMKENYGIKGVIAFADKILYQASFITMTAETNADKSLLFKTLNARGIELSQSDLIKNEICRNLKRCSIDEAVTKWDDIREEIEESKANIDVALFHYINSLDVAQNVRRKIEAKKQAKVQDKKQGIKKGMVYYPPIPEKCLFDAYEYQIGQVSDTKAFLKEMHASLSVYATFSSPDIQYGKEYTHPLRALKELSAMRCYPFLLHAYRVLDSRQFSKLCKAIEILTFRHSTICQKDAKELEKFYYELQYKLKSNNDIVEILKVIRKHESIKDEDRFKLNFLSASPKPSVSKFILCRIICERQEPIDWKAKNAHLEHIMPKSPANEWLKLYQSEEDKDKYKGYLNRLGNLTILQGKKNIINSNKKFAGKCKLYSESRISLTFDLAKKWKNWDFTTIEKRQNDVYELAKNIWNGAQIK